MNGAGLLIKRLFNSTWKGEMCIRDSPMMANEVLNLLKGTSIAALITVVELFGAANIQAALTNLYLEIYTLSLHDALPI